MVVAPWHVRDLFLRSPLAPTLSPTLSLAHLASDKAPDVLPQICALVFRPLLAFAYRRRFYPRAIVQGKQRTYLTCTSSVVYILLCTTASYAGDRGGETTFPLAAFPSISQDLSFREIFYGYRLWFGLSNIAKRQEPFPPLHEYTGQQHLLEGTLNFYNLLWHVVLTPLWKSPSGTRSQPIDLETTSSDEEMADLEVGDDPIVDVDQFIGSQPFKVEEISGLIYEADLSLLRAASNPGDHCSLSTERRRQGMHILKE
ncbi:hypothetical protein RHMOL_Rhmol10G0139500 [Rhododendron molle]|uniref:Uncharacterized protein n=1 Tax=Rhododendron molle TaxID=49168 RepID=A0ACC0M208_RHOML|nr:hypothetical protein RHMOL_Rhmol10G0139500 [Rhododendron molle]